MGLNVRKSGSKKSHWIVLLIVLFVGFVVAKFFFGLIATVLIWAAVGVAILAGIGFAFHLLSEA